MTETRERERSSDSSRTFRVAAVAAALSLATCLPVVTTALDGDEALDEEIG